MARTIYENIGVEFVLEEVDEYEAKIKVNDKTLILSLIHIYGKVILLPPL